MQPRRFSPTARLYDIEELAALRDEWTRRGAAGPPLRDHREAFARSARWRWAAGWCAVGFALGVAMMLARQSTPVMVVQGAVFLVQVLVWIVRLR
jgi:hypothetical protein